MGATSAMLADRTRMLQDIDRAMGRVFDAMGRGERRMLGPGPDR